MITRRSGVQILQDAIWNNTGDWLSLGRRAKDTGSTSMDFDGADDVNGGDVDDEDGVGVGGNWRLLMNSFRLKKSFQSVPIAPDEYCWWSSTRNQKFFFLGFKIFQAGSHFETLSCYESGVTGGGVASTYCEHISVPKSIYCWRLRCQKQAFLFIQFRNDPA